MQDIIYVLMLLACGFLLLWSIQILISAKNRKVAKWQFIMNVTLIMYFILIKNQGERPDNFTVIFFYIALILVNSTGTIIFIIKNYLFGEGRHIHPAVLGMMLASFLSMVCYVIISEYGLDIIDLKNFNYNPLYGISNIIQISLNIIVIYDVIKNKADDLINLRFKFRQYFVILTAALVILMYLPLLLIILLFINSAITDKNWLSFYPDFIEHVYLWWMYTGIVFGLLVPALGQSDIGRQAFNDWEEPKGSTRSARERQELEEMKGLLTEFVEGRKIYRTKGLSLPSMAEAMNVPDHVLRQLINKQLGYRNFNAFVNHYRIRDAKAILASPRSNQTLIQQLPDELGFGTVVSFNRTFKTMTGMTPSAYRATLRTN